jgi:hypothetical protein
MKPIYKYILPEKESFGIEIEGGVSNKKCYCKLALPYHNFTRECLAEFLKDQGFKCSTIGNLPIEQEEAFKKGYWVISDDGSIHEIGVSAEIKSPVLFGEKGLLQINEMLNALLKIEFKTNITCGFHVHIGRQYYSLKNVLSLIAFQILFERQINFLVNKSRIGNMFAKSFRSRHQQHLWEDGRITSSKDPYSYLFRNLNRIKTFSGLKSFFPEKYYRVNVFGMDDHDTIEFRQLEGTLNMNKIATWIRFLFRMLEICRKKDYTKSLLEYKYLLYEEHPLISSLEREIGYKILKGT